MRQGWERLWPAEDGCRDVERNVSTEAEPDKQEVPAGHLSGQPDGAACVKIVQGGGLLPRRGAQIKMLMSEFFGIIRLSH